MWNKKVILGTAAVSDSEVNGFTEMIHAGVSCFQQQILGLVNHSLYCFLPPVPLKSIMEKRCLHHSRGLFGTRLDGST